MSAQSEVQIVDQKETPEEQQQQQQQPPQKKKFRKMRDYFGKRKFNGSGASENRKPPSFTDEDSNDSGVSRSSGNGATKGEPKSPSTGSNASKESESTAAPEEKIVQRVKVIRLEEEKKESTNTSFQNHFRGHQAKNSSTPIAGPSKPKRRIAEKKQVAVKQQQQPQKKEDPRPTGVIEQLKRSKWEKDLARVIGLLQTGKPLIVEPVPEKKKPAKQPPKPKKEEPVVVRMSSSKRRIIPKQRISV